MKSPIRPRPRAALPVHGHGAAAAPVLWFIPALLLAAPAAPGAGGKRQPDAAAVARKVQRFYEGTQGFSADFTQVVRKKGLKKGLPPLKGRVYLKKGRARRPPAKAAAPTAASAKATSPKAASGGAAPVPAGPPEAAEPGKMRWDYPAQDKYYFSDGVVLWSYERRERLAVKLPVKNSRLYQATSYLVGQGDLARDFKLELVPSPLPHTWALKLVPKEGTQVMRSLTLVIDRRSFAVRASVLVDPLGDSITLRFSNPSYAPLSDEVFAWKPPPGVTIKSL